MTVTHYSPNELAMGARKYNIIYIIVAVLQTTPLHAGRSIHVSGNKKCTAFIPAQVLTYYLER